MIRTLLQVSIFVVFASSALAQSGVEIYSAKQLGEVSQALSQKGTHFANKDLERYRDHYTMLAWRDATGSSEVHEHEADIYFITGGQAVIVSGGKLIHPETQKPGELRGTGIDGGERHSLGTGDVVHIPAGVPHQLLIEKDKPVTYFVVKVTGQ